jgi:hypothetical protein
MPTDAGSEVLCFMTYAFPCQNIDVSSFALNALCCCICWPNRPSVAVTFLDAGEQFAETWAYRDMLYAARARAVAAGDAPRAGNWSGTGKIKCGVHTLLPLLILLGACANDRYF